MHSIESIQFQLASALNFSSNCATGLASDHSLATTGTDKGKRGVQVKHRVLIVQIT